MRLLHSGDVESANRMGRGHRRFGKRRWDDAIQATVSEHTDEQGQMVAQDRNKWQPWEAALIAQVSRVSRVAPSREDEAPKGDATCSERHIRPTSRNGLESGYRCGSHR